VNRQAYNRNALNKGNRQLSLNQPVNNQDLLTNRQISSNAAHSQNALTSNRFLTRIKKRSKTQEDLNINNFKNNVNTKLTPGKSSYTINTSNRKTKATTTTTPQGPNRVNKNNLAYTRSASGQSTKTTPKIGRIPPKTDGNKRFVTKKDAISKSPIKIMNNNYHTEDDEDSSNSKQPVKSMLKRYISLRSSGDEMSHSSKYGPSLNQKPQSSQSDHAVLVSSTSFTKSKNQDDINLEKILDERSEKQNEIKDFLSRVSQSSSIKSPFKDVHNNSNNNETVQAKLSKQREEMRLQRERNLKEFKMQLKSYIKEQESVDFETSYYNRVISMPANLTCN
jgi:hypothetical protein